MHKPVDQTGHATPQDQSPRLPLSRFKVLDLTLARAGPSCVRTLADWGADVIRVEPPPEAGEASEVVGRRDGSDFQNLHRNKRAITLNLKTDEGREVFMRLAEQGRRHRREHAPQRRQTFGCRFRIAEEAQPAHRLWQHFRLRPVRPLYRAALDRPDRAGHDRHHVGDGIPGQGPLRVGVAVTDIMAGAFLAQGILIALLDREVSGEGRWVQTSLLEAGITLMDFQATRWTMDKKVPPQEGNNHPTNTPMGLFPTADGFLNLSATGNKNFAKFCKLIDREKMIADPRFASSGLRSRNREALNELITAALRTRSSREWFELMVAEGLPCGPVYNVKDVFADPQVEQLRIKRSVSHPRLGELDLIAQPCEITGFDRNLRSATPDLGEHNDEVLRSLGYDAEAKSIAKLKAAKAI